ncbi:N-acetyltransferase [Dictyobacter sp. S3.2.2.5]|uniref:N-acetyltransferase n=1 Tax=Dictyobacter halimunensis TaxID=3026934 RepID=A0ABQ6FMR3_9CHLR|nr:N-acetyltransferase [Dictyobacter sp. S3.2.2.5]
MQIRMLHEGDAEAFLRLRQQVNEETTFMLREPDENALLAKQQLEQFLRNSPSNDLLILVAEDDQQLAGFLIGERGLRQRNRRRLSLVVGLLQAFVGRGIGTQLFITMEDWARQNGILRLELTVMIHNKAAVALYQKRGFVIEGTMRQTMLIEGNYIDEYMMAKLLG